MNPPSLNLHEPLLVNLSGHSAGAIIFGIFLYLFLQNRKAEMPQGSWPAVAAAALALLWNLGSLSVLAGLSTGWAGTEWLACITLCCLTLLPAVLFHLSLQEELVPLIRSGYALSAIAVAMQIESLALDRPNDRVMGLLWITVGFGALTAISATLLFLRPEPAKGNAPRGRVSRIVGSMCLFLLAMSFVHLGSGQPMQTWSHELALHHCGIPLALFVLLQDYRFVLIDAFIRFLVNYLLAAGVALGAVKGAIALHVIAPLSTGGEAIFVAVVCLALICFAVFRNLVQRWLTRVVFRRPGLEPMRKCFKELAAQAQDERQFLSEASSAIAAFMKAQRYSVFLDTALPDMKGLPELPRWVEASFQLQFAQDESCTIALGRREGGRRYLSEDHEALSRLASFLTEEVGRLREAEVQRLVSGAELRALQSQINPHFLFNSFNALYGIIPRTSEAARRTVLNLTTIFRYLLQSPQSFVRLAEEMQIVEAYLEIEKLRLGSRLQIDLNVSSDTLECLIPTLSIQPLVENAVKHGVAVTSEPGVVWVRTNREGDRLLVTVENTCPVPREGGSETGAGIGLANVRRRLELCFGADSSLHFQLVDGLAHAEFRVPAKVAEAPRMPNGLARHAL